MPSNPHLFTRPNRRHLKAQMIVGMVMQIMGKYITDREYEKKAIEELYDACMQNGIEFITDFTRTELGLPPRGPDGWTQEEIKAYETKLRDAMLLHPLPPFPNTIIPKSK